MKKNVPWMILSLLLLFGVPLLTAKLAGMNGMAICFLLFFLVYPVFFLWEGIFSGWDIKKRWFLPLLSALIYVISMWVVFTPWESAFCLYAAVYALVGSASMGITHGIKKKH